jgi:hypothetical protein
MRWKSKSINIRRLGYRFSKDFLIHTWVWFSFWKSQTFGKSLTLFVRGLFFILLNVALSKATHPIVAYASCIN